MQHWCIFSLEYVRQDVQLYIQLRCLFACGSTFPALRGFQMDTKTNKSGKIDVIPIRVTPAEKSRLLELAQAHGLKLSEYMRQAGLVQEITSRTEVETVLQLAKINADQARLGNLLKLAIDMENNVEIEQLIAEIRQTQQQLKDAVNRI